METLKDCKVCFCSFDTQKHAPRSLPCGHTLCYECLKRTLTLPHLRKCPFDNQAFTSSQNSIESFPPNFVLLEFLDQKNSDTCRVHPDEKLKLICLTDQRRLCYECLESGEHKGHIMKKIKELKDQGVKVKEELESVLQQLKNYEQDKETDCEMIRKKFLSTIGEQCKEINKIIVDKQFELMNCVNNIFRAEKQQSSENIFALKQQLDETIKDIKETSNDDSQLFILEKALRNDQSLAKMLPELLKEEYLGVQNKFLEMQKSLEQSLSYSKEVVNALQLSSEEVVKEIYSSQEGKEQLSEEKLSEIHQKLKTLKFVSYFDVKKTCKNLEVSMGTDEPKEIEVNDEEFKEVETIYIKLGRFDLIMKEEAPNLLTHIFRNRLEKLTSLEISFDWKEFSGHSIIWLAHIISDSVQSLKSFSFDLEKCHVCDDTLQYFCNFVLSKMRNLKDFYLYLNSFQTHSLNLEIWFNALTPFLKNLECFALGLDNNHLVDNEIYQVYRMIQKMEGLKNLQLILSRTKITDRSLEVLGESVVPRLKVLGSFTLCVSECRISDKGVLPILKSLGKLEKLELYLSGTLITDKTVNVLFGEVIQKLGPLASLTFLAKNTRVSMQEFHKIRGLIMPGDEEEF